jgi:hypothetical protein
MEEREHEGKVVPLVVPEPDPLPYAIELWDLPRDGPERILGRAASMVLARAIFLAAQSEHLGRKILLKRGSRVMAESG